MFGLDGAWAALWVLQLTVQAVLPDEHRAYDLDAVTVMMALYVAQALLTVPLVHYLFRSWVCLVERVVVVATGPLPVLGDDEKVDPVATVPMAMPVAVPVAPSAPRKSGDAGGGTVDPYKRDLPPSV